MTVIYSLDAYANGDGSGGEKERMGLNPTVVDMMTPPEGQGSFLAEEDELPPCPPDVKEYFKTLKFMIERSYEVAKKARSRGYDPELDVEIPLVSHMATRVEQLVGPKGIAERIKSLSATVEKREALAIQIAKEISEKGIKEGGKAEEVIYQAIRTALAIVTEGVLVAPLEGITGVRILSNPDGSKFLSLMFSGPIRSAGGTGQALSVLIGDIVRRMWGIGPFKPTDEMVERYKEEIFTYRRRNPLQYTPTQEEIELVVRNCPVCIDGEATEDEEITGYRDIEYFPNRIRGGVALVISEGICLKAAKIKKIVEANGIGGWEFLDRLIGVVETHNKKSSEAQIDRIVGKSEDMELMEEDEALIYELDMEAKVKGSTKYIKEVLAGRPIFALPNRKGGFRLRYGRTRMTGIAAIAIHPATCTLLENFLAVGTQIKIERPGKAGIVTVTDSIEPPIVLLKNGSLVEVRSMEEAERLMPHVERITDLGEILIPFGEFLENNRDLVPGAYSVEWWVQEYAKVRGIPVEKVPEHLWDYERVEAKEAIEISERYRIHLHPKYNLFWHDISVDDALKLRAHIIETGEYKDENLVIRNEPAIKEILVDLGVLHDLKGEWIYIDNRYSLVLPYLLGLDGGLKPRAEINNEHLKEMHDTPITLVFELSQIKLRKRAPVRIGARMGRPEKASQRMLRPPVHVLFPIGEAGGSQRLIQKAALPRRRVKSGGGGFGLKKADVHTPKIVVEVGRRYCENCREYVPLMACPKCGTRTRDIGKSGRPSKVEINVGELLALAKEKLSMQTVPKIKGIKGMMSAEKIPEPLEKGLLRAKHDVYVFKDGTCRYDMTDAPLTHFTAKEIGITVEMLKALGYEKDAYGNALEREDQLVELKPQDIIPSEMAGYYLVKVAQFVDEELELFYGLEAFYRAKTPLDLVGHLVIGLAPHTSAGVVGRIIGYTKSKVCYAHPYYHTAKRRNCDGDEDCIMLLMDGLLNFSRHYLPEKRGGKMDAPLVLTSRIDPLEVDKEVHNLDTMTLYPLEMYNMALQGKNPKEVAKIMDYIGKRLNTPDQYSKLWFTTPAPDINLSPRRSAYTELDNMNDKIKGQMRIARIVDAVEEKVVAEKVLNTHFLPDIMGNLNAFSKQSIRCHCGQKFRRIPLSGRCPKCGSQLILTVHRRSVTKYLEKSLNLSTKYEVDDYLRQRLKLLEKYISDTFFIREESMNMTDVGGAFDRYMDGDRK